MPLSRAGTISQEFRLGEYIGFVLTLALAVTVAFQMPLVILLLGWAGIADRKFLTSNRRYAVLVCADPRRDPHAGGRGEHGSALHPALPSLRTRHRPASGGSRGSRGRWQDRLLHPGRVWSETVMIPGRQPRKTLRMTRTDGRTTRRTPHDRKPGSGPTRFRRTEPARYEDETDEPDGPEDPRP